MATTSNFGWNTPDDTDLVKDGALAIRTLGNNIDTSLVDLKGGTTGQILSKNSNSDLDYTWINNDQGDITEVQAGTGISVASGTGPIPVVTNTVATTFDAKGDLVVGTGADTFAKRTVGLDETRLVADSVETTGVKWVADTTNYAIAAKGDILVGTAADTISPLTVGTNGFVVQADSTTATGVKWTASGRYLLGSGNLSGSTLDLTSISANYTHLEVILRNYYGSQDQQINATINNDSGANQYGSNNASVGNVTYNGSSFTPVFSYDSTQQNNLSIIRYYDYAGSAHKLVQTFINSTDNTNSSRYIGVYHSTIYKSTSAINRLTFTTSAGTWSGGTYELWGVK